MSTIQPNINIKELMRGLLDSERSLHCCVVVEKTLRK